MSEDILSSAGAIIFGIYLIFILLAWLGIAITAHILLSKKGYRNPFLYILIWIPVLNYFTFWITLGLPDALLHRKIDYLLQQTDILLKNTSAPAVSQSASQPVGLQDIEDHL